ncbi:extracellular solute-binding protein [Neomoorella humiferrea]|uniref:extracellular solute-binding protein n=1 Tax=Neomoorella humiferrea TaxID=676965 RepID=UPI003D8AB117
MTLIINMLIMVGCGNKGASQNTGAKETQLPAGKEIKLVITADYKGDAIEKAVAEFQKKSGIKVKIDKLPYLNLMDKLTVSFASGNPDYDVAMIDEPWIAGLAPYLLPLNELFEKDKLDLNQYLPTALNAGKINGKYMVMPLDPNVMMVWYRKDLFEAKGLKQPQNLNDLLEAAKKLHDPQGGVAGLSIVGKKDVQLSTYAILFLWNEGGEVITQDGKFGFDSAAGVKALETYKNVIKYAPSGVLGYAVAETLDAFYNGKAAMVFYWASIGPNATNPEKSKVADKVGWLAIPNAMRGVWTLGIAKESKDKEAAWELIKWLTGPEGSLLYTQYGGGHSPRYDVLRNPDFKKKYPWAEELIKALEQSKARPQTPQWNAIATCIIDMVSSAISGQKSPEAAIKEAAAQVQPYLK